MRGRVAFVLLAVVLACLPLGRGQAAAGKPALDRSFQELGYGDRTVRSMHGSIDYVFPVPGGQAPQAGSQIELVISHSPLLVPDRSTVTVVANGRSLTSAFLTSDSRDRGRVAIPLPVEGFGGDGYSVQVRFHLRLSREQCEETQNPALWATVHGDSRLTLSLAPSPERAGLEHLPGLLRPSAATGAPGPLPIGLPADGGAPAVLQAAGLVAFQYGRWAVTAGDDPLIDAVVDQGAVTGGVLVGDGPWLPPREPEAPVRWDGQSLTGPDGPIARDHGVLAVTSPERPLLVVTGATPAAVLTAAEAIAQPERRAALRGSYAIVTDEPVAWDDRGRPWRNGAASFAQLGVERQERRGPGEHAVRVRFERPPGWVLKAGSTLELFVESAPALRPETSWLSARVNGIELGSRPLEPGGNGPRPYTFPLPADQLTTTLDGRSPRALDLEVRLYLDLPEAGCLQAVPDSAWAAILPGSAWRLPHATYRGLDLGRFPAMFFSPAREPVSVVIPDSAGAAELSAGLTLMAALGRWSGSDDATWPRLVRASDLRDGERRSHHLVLVGDPEQNAVSEAAAKADRTLFDAVDPPVYQQGAGGERRWGILQLGRSPWGRSRVVLTVTGSDADGLRRAAAALATRETLAQIHGRMVMLIDGLPPQSIQGADPAGPPPATLAPRVEQSVRERLQPWQVAGAVLLGGFVAAVALLLLVRSRGGADRY
jgi:cellulose synthase operon protein B